MARAWALPSVPAFERERVLASACGATLPCKRSLSARGLAGFGRPLVKGPQRKSAERVKCPYAPPDALNDGRVPCAPQPGLHRPSLRRRCPRQTRCLRYQWYRAAIQGLRRPLPAPPRHDPRRLGWPSSPKGSRTRGSGVPDQGVTVRGEARAGGCALAPRSRLGLRAANAATHLNGRRGHFHKPRVNPRRLPEVGTWPGPDACKPCKP